MDKFFVFLVIAVIVLFGFFSLPTKWQIRILNGMRSAGSAFSESTQDFIVEQGGNPR